MSDAKTEDAAAWLLQMRAGLAGIAKCLHVFADCASSGECTLPDIAFALRVLAKEMDSCVAEIDA